MPHGRWRIAALATAVCAAVAAPAGAATWTPVPSGTSEEITAIDYRGDAQAWFATGGGKIYGTDAGGAFQLRHSAPGASFTDIAFAPDGVVGIAVTAGGGAYRSADGGVSWAALPLGTVRRTCAAGAPLVPVGQLSSVFWAGPATAYVLGGGPTTAPVVIRLAGTTPTDVNWISPGGGCRVSATHPVTDGAVAGVPSALRFVTSDFGTVFGSADALASPATRAGAMTVGTGGVPRLAVDPANPTRLWVVNRDGNLNYSEAGGADRRPMAVAGSPPGLSRQLYGIGYAGGTLVAAGDSGEIFTSLDGKTALLQRAGGALDATAWRAVGVADAGRALIGGAGGALVRTADANVPPDTTPPSATIAGPASLDTGQPGTYAATVVDAPGGTGVDPASLRWSTPGLPSREGPSATFAFAAAGLHTITFNFRDLAGNAGSAATNVLVSASPAPPGGRARARARSRARGGAGGRSGGGAGATPPNASRPQTQSTGGATITAWKRIALSEGRFVPVRVSARSPRRFVIEVRRAKRPRTRVAMKKARLSRGKLLVRVPLRRTVRTGEYLIVVRVYQGRRAIGKRVRTAFVLVR